MTAPLLEATDLELRVIVLAPTARDGALTREILAEAGIESILCSELDEVAAEVVRGAGAVLLTGEAVSEPGFRTLVAILDRQPAWSDLPILVLTRGGEDARATELAIDLLRNVAILDQPVRIATLVAAVRSAIQARARQYWVRAHLLRHERVEEALRQSEELYRASFELSAAGKAQADPWTSRFLRVNRRLCRLVGFSEEALLDRTLVDLAHPDDRELLRRGIRDLVEGDALDHSEEIRLVRADGGEVWVLASGAVVRDGHGRPLRLVFVLVDVTDRKRALDQLQDSEERLRLALEAGRMAAWELDFDTQEALGSAALGPLHGVDPGGPGGPLDAFFAGVHPDDLEGLRRRLAEVLAAGTDLLAEYRVVRPDGRIAWIETRGRLRRDPERPTRITGVSIDVTERRQAEESIHETNRALRRSNDDLNQFAYAASHDLKEPLRMVAIYSQLLERRFGDRLEGEAETFLENIRKGVHRVEALLSDLLEYSRVADSGTDEVEPVDGEAALRDAISNLEAAIRDSGAHVTWDPLGVVLIERHHLVLLFQNLLSNAIKYRGEAPPRIHVAARREGDRRVFSVSDNGLGIAPEYHEIIFGVFKRLHGREYPGTGIGLALCSRIVERYGGRIDVESTPGAGSTFHVELPAGDAA